MSELSQSYMFFFFFLSLTVVQRKVLACSTRDLIHREARTENGLYLSERVCKLLHFLNMEKSVFIPFISVLPDFTERIINGNVIFLKLLFPINTNLLVNLHVNERYMITSHFFYNKII